MNQPAPSVPVLVGSLAVGVALTALAVVFDVGVLFVALGAIATAITAVLLVGELRKGSQAAKPGSHSSTTPR